MMQVKTQRNLYRVISSTRTVRGWRIILRACVFYLVTEALVASVAGGIQTMDLHHTKTTRRTCMDVLSPVLLQYMCKMNRSNLCGWRAA